MDLYNNHDLPVGDSYPDCFNSKLPEVVKCGTCGHRLHSLLGAIINGGDNGTVFGECRSEFSYKKRKEKK